MASSGQHCKKRLKSQLFLDYCFSAYHLNTRREHVIGLALFACPPLIIADPLMINCGGLNENRKEVILTKELEVLQEGKMDAGQPQAINVNFSNPEQVCGTASIALNAWSDLRRHLLPGCI